MHVYVVALPSEQSPTAAATSQHLSSASPTNIHLYITPHTPAYFAMDTPRQTFIVHSMNSYRRGARTSPGSATSSRRFSASASPSPVKVKTPLIKRVFAKTRAAAGVGAIKNAPTAEKENSPVRRSVQVRTQVPVRVPAPAQQIPKPVSFFSPSRNVRDVAVKIPVAKMPAAVAPIPARARARPVVTSIPAPVRATAVAAGVPRTQQKPAVRIATKEAGTGSPKSKAARALPANHIPVTVLSKGKAKAPRQLPTPPSTPPIVVPAEDAPTPSTPPACASSVKASAAVKVKAKSVVGAAVPVKKDAATASVPLRAIANAKAPLRAVAVLKGSMKPSGLPSPVSAAKRFPSKLKANSEVKAKVHSPFSPKKNVEVSSKSHHLA